MVWHCVHHQIDDGERCWPRFAVSGQENNSPWHRESLDRNGDESGRRLALLATEPEAPSFSRGAKRPHRLKAFLHRAFKRAVSVCPEQLHQVIVKSRMKIATEKKKRHVCEILELDLTALCERVSYRQKRAVDSVRHKLAAIDIRISRDSDGGHSMGCRS